MLSRETMRKTLQEHVDAENAHDRKRVLATYIDDGAEFVDVAAAKTYRGDDAIVRTTAISGTASRDSCARSSVGRSATRLA